jgi:hypothetical protein
MYSIYNIRDDVFEIIYIIRDDVFEIIYYSRRCIRDYILFETMHILFSFSLLIASMHCNLNTKLFYISSGLVK